MFRYGFLLTLVAFATAKVDVVNINEMIDNLLQYVNNRSMSIYPLEEGQFGPQVYHSDGFLVCDSLVRTGDNVYTFDEEKQAFSYEYNIGAKILLATFPQMEVLGKNLTTAFRAYNNSVHSKYGATVKDNRCTFTLEDLSFEKLDGLEFSSTEEQKEFKDEEVKAYFHDVVFPGIKTFLKIEVVTMLKKAMSHMCDKPEHLLENSQPKNFLKEFKAKLL